MGKIVVGNLKMSMITSEVSDYLKEIKKINHKNVIICPSAIYAPYFLKHEFQVGLQDVFYEEPGPYTGTICPKQAVTIGIKYSIIGHSDRRTYFKETNDEINKKIKAAKKYNMTSILCVGETLKEYKSHKTKKVLKKELKKALMNVGDLNRVIVAYEPSWSIGTNKIPTNKQIIENVTFIKKYISKHFHYDMKVLYGGSINIDNILTIRNIEEIDGILVGDASTRASEFIDIIEAFLIRQN